jgi:hypothetical protein
MLRGVLASVCVAVCLLAGCGGGKSTTSDATSSRVNSVVSCISDAGLHAAPKPPPFPASTSRNPWFLGYVTFGVPSDQSGGTLLLFKSGATDVLLEDSKGKHGKVERASGAVVSWNARKPDPKAEAIVRTCIS